MQACILAKVRSSAPYLVLLGALGTACNSTARGPTPSAQVPSSAEQARLTASLHERLVNEAESEYSPGDYKPSVPVPAGTLDPGSGVADLHAWARTMTLNNPAVPPVDQFVGLIYTDKKYKKLGMGKNENYVLKLSTAGNTIFVMVPSDLKIPMTVLDYDRNSTFNHSSHDPPQVVHEVTGFMMRGNNRVASLAIGGCVEGPCPTGHCGFGSSGEEFTYSSYMKLVPASRSPR